MVLRFLSGVLFFIAVVLLVSDVTRWQQGDEAALATSLGQHWASVAPQSLAASQRIVSTRAHPALWDSVAKSLLVAPGSVTFALGGLLLAIASRRRRRVDIFTN